MLKRTTKPALKRTTKVKIKLTPARQAIIFHALLWHPHFEKTVHTMTNTFLLGHVHPDVYDKLKADLEKESKTKLDIEKNKDWKNG